MNCCKRDTTHWILEKASGWDGENCVIESLCKQIYSRSVNNTFQPISISPKFECNIFLISKSISTQNLLLLPFPYIAFSVKSVVTVNLALWKLYCRYDSRSFQQPGINFPSFDFILIKKAISLPGAYQVVLTSVLAYDAFTI